MCAFAPYDLANVKVDGYDVVTNRPKVAAYRAPGGPIAEFAVESVIDEIAGKLGIDPIELRLKNAAKEGTKAAYGPKFGPIGMVETLEAAKSARALAHAAQEEPGPRRRLRLLVQHRRRDLGVAVAQRGRHAVADGRHARHRRPARLAVHDGGRGAEGAARQDPRADRRHRPARLQLPHRRQPRHVLDRHGDGRGRARGHAARPASAPPSCGSCRRTPSSTWTARCVRPAPTPASTRR